MHVDVLTARRRDAGFTLVELLVSATVLGIVLTGIVGISFVAARTTAASQDRLGDSAALTRAASYFSDDVAGAQGITIGAEPLCGTDDEAVVEFSGQDVADDGLTVTTTVVSWVLRDVDEDTAQLRRLSCTAGATPDYPLTPATDEPVAVVQSADEAEVTCDAAGCGPAFTRVSLAATAEGGLAFTLTGRRRTTP